MIDLLVSQRERERSTVTDERDETKQKREDNFPSNYYLFKSKQQQQNEMTFILAVSLDSTTTTTKIIKHVCVCVFCFESFCCCF